jgi:hypothetical protein
MRPGSISEDPPATSPKRARLVALLDRVDEHYGIETAIQDAADDGFEFKFTWRDPTSAHQEVWEHPAATAHNAELDRSTAAILDTFLFKLYELQRDADAPPYVLVVGRVGNTVNYEIAPAAGPVGG